MKYFITESQYKILLEALEDEGDECVCREWEKGTFKQGDGIKTPKITITKTPDLIEGLYEGPDRGGCIQRCEFNDGDTPHQLAGITVFYEAAPYLKELYRNGIFVRPDMKKITMERIPNKKFKISIPLERTTEDKAITNMNERGGMGHEGNLTEIENIKSNPNHYFVQTERVQAGDITETFVSFRNIKNFPILTKPSTNKNDNQPTTAPVVNKVTQPSTDTLRQKSGNFVNPRTKFEP